MMHELKYKLDEEGIKIMLGCSSEHLIQEISDAIKTAYREISVTIDHDPDFGICRIVAVNNHSLCGCS
jgi:formyltetrahydrofolate synthetase